MKPLSIFLVARKGRIDFDENAALVIVAESAHQARGIAKVNARLEGEGAWTGRERATVSCLGTYDGPRSTAHVVLTDFRAG